MLFQQLASASKTNVKLQDIAELGPDENGPGISSSQNALGSYALLPPSQKLEISLEKKPYHPILAEILQYGGYPLLMKDKQSPFEVIMSIEGFQPALLRAVRHAIYEDGRQRHMQWNLIGEQKGVREIVIRPSTRAEEDDQQEEKRKSAGRLNQLETKWREQYVKKWIVAFKTHNERKRFIAAWHRTDIKRLFGRAADGAEEVMVSVEMAT